MTDIRALTAEYDDYRKDESRSVGEADTISFPTCEAEVRATLAALHASRTPVTVQGGRTGLAAGAVPHGGHVLNLSKMNRALGLRAKAAPDGSTAFYLRVQPGVVLSQLRKDLEDKNVSTTGWDDGSLAAWQELCAGPEQFFPTDPTETSATIGGMVACNASGARSYRFGAVRPHVSALRVALADGDVLALRRGQALAGGPDGRTLELVTEGGRTLHVDLPGYRMPQTKNASGYYAADGMDAVDLFVGSDGTLGVICEVELALMPAPQVVWGVNCFFAEPGAPGDEPAMPTVVSTPAPAAGPAVPAGSAEAQALAFTVLVRNRLASAAAVEYFDADALDILRDQKAHGTAFAALPAVPPEASCCVYVEIQRASEDDALADLYLLGSLMEQVGGSARLTWVGRTAIDREQQRFFRHAVPESVNMLIDERRKADPAITKLGSDMSVPDDRLADVVALYRATLREEGLQTAVWGHIGNNHLHVNVLPRDAAEYARGKALFSRWAREVTAMGGAVSAEHGVGKLKRDFLTVMYGEQNVAAMARTKLQLDPFGQLGRGNLFGEDVLRRVATPEEA